MHRPIHPPHELIMNELTQGSSRVHPETWRGEASTIRYGPWGSTPTSIFGERTCQTDIPIQILFVPILDDFLFGSRCLELRSHAIRLDNWSLNSEDTWLQANNPKKNAGNFNEVSDPKQPVKCPPVKMVTVQQLQNTLSLCPSEMKSLKKTNTFTTIVQIQTSQKLVCFTSLDL